MLCGGRIILSFHPGQSILCNMCEICVQYAIWIGQLLFLFVFLYLYFYFVFCVFIRYDVAMDAVWRADDPLLSPRAAGIICICISVSVCICLVFVFVFLFVW